MCGFIGYFDKNFHHNENTIKETNVLKNRGPDSCDIILTIILVFP